MQWEGYLFEPLNAAGWRLVMSRGPDERTQMHSPRYLHSPCDSMSKRELIDDGAAWIQQTNDQQQRDRTAFVKALFNLLDTTTSGRAKDLVRQGLMG